MSTQHVVLISGVHQHMIYPLVEAPCRNRTRDILSTKQALYQNELMGRWKSIAASYLVAAVQVVAD
jgi:hypothetical protein